MDTKLAACILVFCLVGGCATPDPAAQNQPRDEGAYVTGSRLPQKTTGSAPVSQTGQQEWEDSTRGKQVNPQGR